ncbi:FAD/NAD(P)-binding domain-containing protein [Gautieria morchelliformis]|nr:FAD/NAD(P)-binding domain-containing protein [Gautieria morchelliformis]
MGSGKATRICIIGGGAAGLAALKIFQETVEHQAGLWELVAFEACNELGGVWSPSVPVGNPASPLYDALTTNLPHPVMAFSSFWFEPSTPLFPSAHLVLRYLQRYADHFNLNKYIRYNSRVDEASWDDHAWNVRLADGTTQLFDRVVVANGHYNIPRYPAIPGLKPWLDLGRVSHSVFYRNPQPYRDLTVLVVGNGPSGRDICAEVSTFAKTVYHSISGAIPKDIGNIKLRGSVVDFQDSGAVKFEDSSISRVDHTILATGYVLSFPFLPQLRQSAMPAVSSLPEHALNSTYNVFPVARQIFPLQDDFPADSIAFMGLLYRVAPFPLFEAQGRYIAKVFAEPGSIDRTKEWHRILGRYNQLRNTWGNDTTVIAKEWHRFTEPEQFSYRRELLDIAEAPQWYPEDWAEEIYYARDELREAWKKLVGNGEADEWVRGVGEGGREDWVFMMRHLLKVSRNTKNLSRL